MFDCKCSAEITVYLSGQSKSQAMTSQCFGVHITAVSVQINMITSPSITGSVHREPHCSIYPTMPFQGALWSKCPYRPSFPAGFTGLLKLYAMWASSLGQLLGRKSPFNWHQWLWNIQVHNLLEQLPIYSHFSHTQWLSKGIYYQRRQLTCFI